MRIAYLAPEIPALSATFVYHEILALEEKGFDVLPISVHPPASPATEESARNLAAQTILLYPQGIATFLLSAVRCKLRHPGRYLVTALSLLSDMVSLGFFSRGAAALLYRFLAATRLALILEQHGCRHLHVHFAHVPTDIGMYAARLAGITFSFTSHANDLFERGWLLREKVARAAVAVTISDYNRRFLISQGADGAKIVIVRCGVDARRFPKESPLRSQEGKIPVIGSLGRLVEKKGFDTLIAAAGILAESGENFRMEIIGDGPLLAELQAESERLGLPDNVAFFGPVANDLVPAWLGGLDLFVLACRMDSNGDMDGIPVALMEAMAAGVPVISTTVSAIPELIEPGISGLSVPPAEPRLLADAIRNMLVSDDLRRCCSAGGKLKIAAEFSEQGNIHRLSQLFTSLVSGGK